MAEIASLALADPPELWAESASWWPVAGAGSAALPRAGRPGTGIVAWTLRGVDGLSELPVARDAPEAAQPTPEHPNGVTELDHVVVATPDLDRTTSAFEAAGIRLRRTARCRLPGPGPAPGLLQTG